MKFLLVLLCIFFFSCSVKNIVYDKEKINKKYLFDFTIYIDSLKVDFENLYLNRNNIREVVLNKNNNSINIYQKTTPKLISLSEINLDSIYKKPIDFIIFNGVLLDKQKINEICFDPNSIKNLEVLNRENFPNTIFENTDKIYLVITIK